MVSGCNSVAKKTNTNNYQAVRQFPCKLTTVS